MDRVEVVVAHQERVTLRVGDTFLKVDVDPDRADVEVAAMELAPVPTPEVRWRRPPVTALAALPGAAIGRLGGPSTASAAAWVAAGRMVRRLHEAPVPDLPGRRWDPATSTADLDRECAWLVDHDVLPHEVIAHHRAIADRALRPWTPVFAHNDLQVAHVFVAGDEVTGILDWSEAGPGDALSDLAGLTLVHQEHLDDVLTGYGAPVDVDVLRAWWSRRSLVTVRWLVEHGIDPDPTGGAVSPWPRSELDVLRRTER